MTPSPRISRPSIPDLATLVDAYRPPAAATPAALYEPSFRQAPRFSLTPATPPTASSSVTLTVLVMQVLAGVALFGALAFAAASHPLPSPATSPAIEDTSREHRHHPDRAASRGTAPGAEDAAVAHEPTPPGALVDAPSRVAHEGATPAIRHSVLTTPRLRPRPAAIPLDPSVDAMLDAALRAQREQDEPGPRPALPTQHEVTTTLRALSPRVADCGEGAVVVDLRIDGASGRARGVEARGADPETNRCVAEVVEQAAFSRFTRDHLSVAFPYRL